jgi:hypothetical protein
MEDRRKRDFFWKRVYRNWGLGLTPEILATWEMEGSQCIFFWILHIAPEIEIILKTEIYLNFV